MKLKPTNLILLLWTSFMVFPAMADTWIESEDLRLRFGEQGSLLEVTACYPNCQQANPRQFHLLSEEGLVSFESVATEAWDLTETRDDKEQILEFTHPGGSYLRWAVPNKGYGLALTIQGPGGVRVQAGESFRPRPAPGFGEGLEQIRYLGIEPGNVQQIPVDSTEFTELDSEWVGFRSRFWTVLLTADESLTWTLQTGEGNVDPILLGQSGSETTNWHLYLGPVERGALASVDELLPDLMYAGLWFWLRWICIFLALLLGWIQSLLLAWGPSIMLLSLCVGTLMLPLTRLADSVQQQVNRTEARLAPELSRIKREFKGEQQAAKIIALYKTERVHPLYSLKSLLGVAIVIPVFIGAFDMLAENINLMNTPFLWIEDLSRPDSFLPLPFTLPFFGSSLNLLPVFMTALSIWASMLHRPLALQAELRQKQLRNMVLLAAAFFVLFYTFPAGMVLYWTTNNLISVCKNLWSRKFSANQVPASPSGIE